ncbi:hypothetical protein GGTG_12214 [Gaeumannomyces tritici R3-111a-1]|uniref:Uncharacterized protein n=1 Tax=Gaeumannomyces tritici (strain R3-111a-1) TaxID=644352 RepID=J3PFD7_GAET3|nr:hypothetical protein GGTG_12214 [Gaeumannomyces tritici R3-111a-1]EJT70039.1 hypothetical protein GGTG_12214 [Gaeumannomyces tritici R3-111a-1]
MFQSPKNSPMLTSSLNSRPTQSGFSPPLTKTGWHHCILLPADLLCQPEFLAVGPSSLGPPSWVVPGTPALERRDRGREGPPEAVR